MYLENIVFDAVDPLRLGRFWEAALGCERLTDDPAGFETRLTVEGGPVLDLCFQRVPAPPSGPTRLHLGLTCRVPLADEVERLLGLGARHLRDGRSDASGTVLTDPEGTRFRVREDPSSYVDTGPLATLSLDSATPDQDAELWSWLTGWTAGPTVTPSLRHPSRRGPVLELRPETAPKGRTKNRVHLDIRLETADDPDAVAAGITGRGGRELQPEWGELHWRVYADPSGNELCVLPARP